MPCGSTAPFALTNGFYMCKIVLLQGVRGFNRGLIYSQDGTLVASMWEGLIRLHGDAKS